MGVSNIRKAIREVLRADADHVEVIRELVGVERRLRVAREMLEDFRENTSLGTIVSEYEARKKELRKKDDEMVKDRRKKYEESIEEKKKCGDDRRDSEL